MMKNSEKKYDVFISHASEDKDSFVRALAVELERYSVRVWYDEFTMKLGDSLTRSIDAGLQSCRYGVIVLSKHFLEKNWPDYEYRSLLSRQVNGETVILPLLYGISVEDVRAYSLYLADIKSLSVGNEDVVDAAMAIIKVVRPDVWERVKMEVVLKNAVAEGEAAVVPLSQIVQQTTRQSALTRQQIIRAKAIFYGIGKHIGKSFPDYIFTYELDLVPEREIQSWEIMNACYREILERYPGLSEKEIKEVFRVLLLLSIGIGAAEWPSISLSDELTEEIVRLWLENYYEF